jgi:hypothetical protein
LEEVEGVYEESWVFVIDVVDGDGEVLLDVEIGFEFLRVLEGKLEDVVE